MDKKLRNGKRHALKVGNDFQKLKTPIKIRFTNKIIMFEKTLDFEQVNILCYGKQRTLNL
jgi:hypothetical protein